MRPLKQLRRLKRVPARARRTLGVVRVLRNWPSYMLAEMGLADLRDVRCRNGVKLKHAGGTNLKFLFDEIWIHRVYTPRGYEPRAGDTVIDIGANIGVFATFAASYAPGISVLAYEPFPSSAAALRANVAASRLENVRVFDQAVAAECGQRLLLTSRNWVMHSLVSGHDASRDRADDTITVECVGLDEVFDANGITVCNLLKVDCEGSEYEIFRACSPATWRRVKRVVVEYHEGPGVPGTGQELRELLTSNGFVVDRMERLHDFAGYICARAGNARHAPHQ